MPEGDTIARTASTLQRWLAGRRVTSARSQLPAVPAERLIGDRIDAVDSRGKHLLMRFESGGVLHSHMRMEGSWHVYPAGEPWRRPAWQARLVIDAGGRLAVCFNAPVIEWLAPGGEQVHPVLAALGPDVLDPAGLDLDAVTARAAGLAPNTPIGDVLLDQRVLAGIGNIYRSEVLFLAGVHPEQRLADIAPETLKVLAATASRLMAGPRGPAWVYRRRGRPCRRCGVAVASARVGVHARTVYWCRRCQPLGGPGRP